MPSLFQFGAFEVDPASAELRKHGVKIKLHAQPFQVLLMLLEHQGRIVTRSEMRERLWDQGTFVDFEHGLNTAINKIREALTDSATRPRYIETVPGKGYRFIATVSGPQPDVAPPPPVAAPLPPSRRVFRTLLILIQLMYLAFYFGALGNLAEIHEIFLDANWGLSASAWMGILVTTAAILIPVRLFLLVGVIFDFPQLPKKFQSLFPVLFVLDMLWALSPFLLIHHINHGIALGMTATLVYLPFAQRSLISMYDRVRSPQTLC